MDEIEKNKIEDAKILENPGIEFRNKLDEIIERMTAHEKSLINEFTDRIILLIIRGAYNKVEKRMFVENEPNTMTFIFKMDEQYFPKTLWEEIRDLCAKTGYEAAMLKEELESSINLKLKLKDIQIFNIMLRYSDIEIQLYYKRGTEKPKNEN